MFEVGEHHFIVNETLEIIWGGAPEGTRSMREEV